jgi:hypothetical protein
MSEAAALALADAVPWLGFWAFMMLCVWVAHKQHEKGHDTWFFGYSTEAELRIQEALVRKLEIEAEIPAPKLSEYAEEEDQ